MTLADTIAASTANYSSSTAGPRKNTTVKADTSDRPRNNSPAFQAYEDKKNACEAKIADIRARMVN